jgi:hypothetical protein
MLRDFAPHCDGRADKRIIMWLRHRRTHYVDDTNVYIWRLCPKQVCFVATTSVKGGTTGGTTAVTIGVTSGVTAKYKVGREKRFLADRHARQCYVRYDAY